MDKNKLGLEEDVEKFLASIKSELLEADFEAPPGVREDYARRNSQDALDIQKSWHRNALLCLIVLLSIASFIFLVAIIGFQMIIRKSIPGYVGVSDNVIQVVTVGVFGEVITIVGVIARLVWKDPKR